MRVLIAIAFGCALMLGITQAASSGTAPPSYVPASEPAPTAEDTNEGTDEGPTGAETSYECRYSPYCRSASQCTAYCAGGAAVCSQGCCACAS